MTVYPLMLDGAQLDALVVGAGDVALRKTRALLDAGATVRVVAPEVADAFDILEGSHVRIARRPYDADDIGDAMLVVAATSSRAVNAQVTRDARARGRLVNVADAPDEGNCTTAAVHRAGELVIAVTAGGVPAIAARVRDAIARRFAGRYADAVAQLSTVRSALLASGQRDRWAQLSTDAIGADFCDVVDAGMLSDRLKPWR